MISRTTFHSPYTIAPTPTLIPLLLPPTNTISLPLTLSLTSPVPSLIPLSSSSSSSSSSFFFILLFILILILILILTFTFTLTLTITHILILLLLLLPLLLLLLPLQEDSSEAAKYELLHKRDQDMTAFMDKFDEVSFVSFIVLLFTCYILSFCIVCYCGQFGPILLCFYLPRFALSYSFLPYPILSCLFHYCSICMQFMLKLMLKLKLELPSLSYTLTMQTTRHPPSDPRARTLGAADCTGCDMRLARAHRKGAG